MEAATTQNKFEKPGTSSEPQDMAVQVPRQPCKSPRYAPQKTINLPVEIAEPPIKLHPPTTNRKKQENRAEDQLRLVSFHSYTTTPRSLSVLITVSTFRRTSGRAFTGT